VITYATSNFCVIIIQKGCMMLKKTLLLLIVFLFTSCVQVPKGSILVSTTQTKAPRIGYLVNVRSYPTHTHYGTTPLTNFTKTYHYNWRIPYYIETKLEQDLKLINTTPVNLRNKGIRPSQVNGMLKKKGNIWIISSGFKDSYLNLANRLDLTAIIIINETAKIGLNECGILGCKELKANGYGLLSKSFINSNKFYSATALFAHLYQLKPKPVSLDAYLADINHDREMTLVAISKGSKVEPNKINFVYPKNFNQWTKEEFKPFRAPLLKYIDGMSKKITQTISENILSHQKR